MTASASLTSSWRDSSTLSRTRIQPGEYLVPHRLLVGVDQQNVKLITCDTPDLCIYFRQSSHLLAYSPHKWLVWLLLRDFADHQRLLLTMTMTFIDRLQWSVTSKSPLLQLLSILWNCALTPIRRQVPLDDRDPWSGLLRHRGAHRRGLQTLQDGRDQLQVD
jgi:hypothetical protein